MRKLNILPGNALQAYDQIVGDKHEPRRSRLRALRALVGSGYSAYQASAPHLQSITPALLSNGNAADLLHCYEKPTASLNQLKAHIRMAQTATQMAFCPYCGINSPNTFEHYLPQAEYPELAVCQYNLIPACGECNTMKGSKWAQAGRREIIHFYFDNLPYQSHWLTADVSLSSNEPIAKYKLSIPPEINPALRDLISEHYRRLDLLNRYRARSVEAFSDALSGNRGSLAQHELAELYSDRASDYSRDYGHNYWKVAIYRGMAESTDFLNYATGTIQCAA